MEFRATLHGAATWWRERSTRARLRILVAAVGLLGLLLRDLLLIGVAGFTLLLAETLPAAKPQPRPN